MSISMTNFLDIIVILGACFGGSWAMTRYAIAQLKSYLIDLVSNNYERLDDKIESRHDALEKTLERLTKSLDKNQQLSSELNNSIIEHKVLLKEMSRRRVDD